GEARRARGYRGPGRGEQAVPVDRLRNGGRGGRRAADRRSRARAYVAVELHPVVEVMDAKRDAWGEERKEHRGKDDDHEVAACMRSCHLLTSVRAPDSRAGAAEHPDVPGTIVTRRFHTVSGDPRRSPARFLNAKGSPSPARDKVPSWRNPSRKTVAAP